VWGTYQEFATHGGDENTNFFHSTATERYRKNVISQILDPSGRMVSDHGEKSALFFQEFKNRLGFSVDIMLQFDLQALIMPHPNLEHLCLPFSTDEINEVILEMPNDKAPGHDGFNNTFFKKAWHIIRNDIYNLCDEFYHHHADLKCINYSYITLVPKKDNPECVNDYRPIFLVNSAPKLIYNLLANWLQPVILDLVHENQYGFIKGKTIQDCLGWAFEYLHQFHHSKRENVVLKIDFEKAFDHVEHSLILEPS
jgi:hypothetical protein